MTLRPPTPDVLCGMTAYATSGPRTPGSIRARREDFVVEEILDTSLIESERKDGYVPVYSLSKAGIDTPHAAEELAASLRSKVNFAGLKDSNAVTKQYASARSSRADDPPHVHGSRFEAERVGYLPRPISRGMMAGNRFRIAVTSADGDAVSRAVSEAYRACAEGKVPNFFGYQRFGLRGMVNHRVGKAILRRDFAGAVRVLLGEPRTGESPRTREARGHAAEGRYREALDLFSAGQDIERFVCARLAQRPDDSLGALRRVPMVARRLFVQAYQSYVFNRTASEAAAAGLDLSRAREGDNWTTLAPDGLRSTRTHGVREPTVEGAVPLIQIVGYAFRDYRSRFDAITVAILREEGVDPREFYIKEAEELSNEGGFRHAPLLAADLATESAPGRVTLSFSLGRGEYATTLLREVLKPEDPLASGF
ncbi:MAG: tRNA pseudouridine(13) synthase TruD [Nitrososphaerales archaeon]